MNEVIWKDIAGFEGEYQVSNTGLVRRREKKMVNGCLEFVPGRIKVLGKVRGYLYADMTTTKRLSVGVHRLVAIAFIPNPRKLPEVNHKDGNKKNNNVSNLEWVTSSENKKHAYKIGLMQPPRGEKCGMHKITENQVREIKQLRKQGLLHKDIAAQFSLGVSTITHILLGTRWAHVK